jgi:hypothetical protein
VHLEGHLAELDINPLTVLPSGQGAKALDAHEVDLVEQHRQRREIGCRQPWAISVVKQKNLESTLLYHNPRENPGRM